MEGDRASSDFKMGHEMQHSGEGLIQDESLVLQD